MTSPAGPPLTIPELLSQRVAAHPGDAAVVDGGVTTTWAELAAAASAFGASLIDRGVEPGDRVAIWAPNGLRWIVAVLGIWEAGAAVVPINTRFRGGEAADVLRRSGARVVVTVTDFLGVDHAAMLRGEDLPGLVVLTEHDEVVPSDEAIEDVARRATAVSTDDMSDILYTSGTTGRPKGVVQTHGRTLCVARDWVAMTGLHHGDRYLMVNPYFHMFGLKAGILASIAAGATMYPEATFDTERTLRRIGEERITVLPGAPTIYQSLLDTPDRDRYDLQSLRVAVTGAADIPVSLVHRVREELPFEVVVTGYGLTEAGTATATSPDDDAATVATTVGRARPGFELRLDGDGDGVGEILLRGPSVMAGYLDDPDATAEVLVDGWLRTGDLGTLDPAGNLRIVGRSKDMFIVGGFNVYPAEVENLLLGHPDVAQAAVVGMADHRLGEVGAAFVVPRAGATLEEGSLIAWAREHMANYKAPRRVIVIDELPLNATGKVAKDRLRDQLGPSVPSES